MKLTIYAKKITKNDGTKFVKYSTTLTNKDSSTVYATVKFNQECPLPKYDSCPMNIIVDKTDCSLSRQKWKTDESEGYNNTLWIKAWKEDTSNPFVDHSMDDFV